MARTSSKNLATEIINDLKKRLFIKNIVISILSVLLIGSIGYNIYLTYDIGYEEITETTTETYEVEQDSSDGGNNNFITGDNNEVNNG